MDTIKRINLRINIEDPIDKVVWNFIKDEKKKGTFIKKIIYDLAIGNTTEISIDKLDEIDISEIDDSGMEGF